MTYENKWTYLPDMTKTRLCHSAISAGDNVCNWWI